MSSKSSTVEISVLGQKYTVKCPQQERETLQVLVKKLNHVMADIQKKSDYPRFDQIAVMAALSLCHDLFEVEKSHKNQTKPLENKIELLQDTVTELMEKMNS